MKKAFVKMLLILGLVVAALFVWGLIEPRVILDERQARAPIPALPAAWEGAEIAVLGDFQIGIWLANEQMVRQAVARVVERKPAAVLLTGDLLYKPTDEESQSEAQEEIEPEDRRGIARQIAQSVALVRPLTEAGIPTYAVLGNHDYLAETPQAFAWGEVADELARALADAGVRVLRNEAVAMERKGAQLYLGGVDSLYARRARPAQVLDAIPAGAPRILLMHNPDVFVQLPPHSAPLAVAGHTHGGQARLPGLPDWSLMSLMQKEAVTADGWIRKDYGAAGNRLYVNRGIGFSFLPVRINCPPELTWFTLKKAA